MHYVLLQRFIKRKETDERKMISRDKASKKSIKKLINNDNETLLKWIKFCFGYDNGSYKY